MPSVELLSRSLEILLVDDEPDLRGVVGEVLEEAGHHVTMASDGAQALALGLAKPFDAIVCDIRLPLMDGLSLLRRFRQDAPNTDFILMTAHADVRQAVGALKEGAAYYLTKPFEAEELLVQLSRIADRRVMERDLAQARRELRDRGAKTALIGQSPAMLRVLGLIDTVAPTDAPTLITGESGTGKELVARMLHERGARQDRPFVVINCGALTETLIEAELFGHERGAFTGADRKREGRFKAADGGVIFLDEIAELSATAQVKLLRVLQEGTFEPVGSNTPIKVDVRVLSATHRNLAERVRQGLFREDLFYRINVIEIPLPPLRQRPGDLSILVRHFLMRFLPGADPLPEISPAGWAALSGYRFPGNVRELSHAIQHAAVLSAGRPIGLQDFPASISGHSNEIIGVPAKESDQSLTLDDAKGAFECNYVRHVVAQAKGKRARAAKILGISRKSLWEKMKRHGIEAPLSGERDPSPEDLDDQDPPGVGPALA